MQYTVPDDAEYRQLIATILAKLAHTL